MSTEIQLRGDSRRRQLQASEDYAKRRGLTLEKADRFEDIGVSAFKGANRAAGALGRFLAALEAGRVERGSYLLVESLDRLSRDNVIEAMELFLSIIRRGITIVTLADGMEYAEKDVKDQGWYKLMISLAIMSRAHDESRTKSSRLSAAWANKRANVHQKKLTKMTPGWLRLSPDRKSFEVIPERATIARQMFEDSKNGVGTISITRRLNEQKVPTWGRGKHGWQRSAVARILASRGALGELTPRKKVGDKWQPLEPIRDYYPPIITEDLFYGAKAARESRMHRGGRKGRKFTNLFSTLLKCAYCGRPVHIQNKGPKPKGGIYLRCDGALRALGCKSRGWDYESFETNFLALVGEVDLSAVVNDDRRSQKSNELTRLRDQEAAAIKDEKSRQEQLIRVIESGAASEQPKILLDRIAALEGSLNGRIQKVRELDEQLKSVSFTSTLGAEREEQLRALLKQLNEPGADVFAQRARLAQLIREVVDHVLLFPDGRKTSAEDDAHLASKLKEAGFEQSAIDQLVRERAVPARAYFVWFKSGTSRFVMPDPQDATRYSVMRDPEYGLVGPMTGAVMERAARLVRERA